MSRAIAGELLKLRTTRTFAALVGSTVALVALIVGLSAALGEWDGTGELSPGRELLSAAGIAQLFALVLGILAVTSEFRHGTITPTLLVVPDRVRLMVAKVAVHLLGGIVLGVVTVALALLLGAAILSARDVETGLSVGVVLEDGLGNAVAIALCAAIGVGVGAIVRNQVGAIVGALAYLFVIEGLLTLIPGVDDVIETYGLNALLLGVAPSELGGDEVLAPVPAGLLLTLYAAILAAVGTVLLRRRDVAG